MDTFAEHSKHIATITATFGSSRLTRLMCWIEWRRRRFQNCPLHFKWASEEGVPVGEPMNVGHLTMHDMLHHSAQCMMTDLVLLRGMRVNAVESLGTTITGDMWGVTKLQPRWID